jgi:uncharacterized protein
MKKIIISLSPICNLKCKYCYVGLENEYFILNAKNNICLIKDEINKTLQKASNPPFIQFLGGEPTLYLKEIREIVDFINDHPNCYPNKIKYGIVTNGVWHNTKEIIDVFKKYSFEVTVSLDGKKEIHDQLRVYKKNKGTCHIVLNTIELLKKHSISFSIEAVISTLHLSDSHSIINLMDLSSNLGAKKLYFDPAYPPAPSEIMPLSSTFMHQILDLYIKSYNHWYEKTFFTGQYYINCMFTDITIFLIKGKSMFDEILCEAGKDLICMDHVGKKHACNLFIGYDNRDIHGAFSFPEKYESIKNCKCCASRYWCKVCPANNVRFGDAFTVNKAECFLKKGLIKFIANKLNQEKLLTVNTFTKPLLNMNL